MDVAGNGLQDPIHPRGPTHASENARQAATVMRMAKDAADNLPKRIRTDRMKSYPSAIKREFDGEVEPVQTDGLAAVVNNNLVERLNGTVKERDKVFRGFKRLGVGPTVR